MNGNRSWLFRSGILVLTFMMTGIAHAQDDSAYASGQLPEEVLVTAQKKEQDVRDVPSSVATLSDEKLDVITAGGQDIRLLSSRVPSLHIESSYGRTLPRFYIRGLGNTDFDLNASQPVSLVYDEVVLENPILKGFPIFDLERVEVLRGPQGTLFGRNTPAGIVKFESKKPTHVMDGFARVSYGQYGTMQFEGALGGPLAEDVLAARASFLYQGRSDWVDNTFTEEDNALGGYADIAGRVQFLLTPDDKFSALLNVHMRDLDGTARLFRADIVESGSNEIADGIERDEVGIDGKNEQNVEEMGGVAKLEYDFGDVTLTSVTGYESGEIFSRGDVDGGIVYDPAIFRFAAETADGIPKLDQFTEELRLASNGWDQVNFQAGFFYFSEDLEIDTINFDTQADGQPENGRTFQHQETTAWAAFGTVEVDVTETFKASGGIRYSDDEKDFTANRETSPIGGGALEPDPINLTTDFVSWDLSGLLQASEDVNVYGRVARSFRAPSIQGRILFGDEISVADKEKILSFEGGVKANLSKRTRGNLSIFHYTMDDQQLTAVGGAANFNRLFNADKTKGSGWEAELEILPTDQLFITVGASHNNTEIHDPNLKTQAPGAAGVTGRDGNPLGSDLISIDGNSLPNAPEWVFTATARGAIPVGDQGEVFVFTDWAYRSEVSFFLYESTEFIEKNLVEGGLRIGYAPYSRSYEFSVFARNITDNKSRTGGIDFNNITGFLNEPRTWGVELRRNF